MTISEAEYHDILERQGKGALLIYIDKSSFRQFFMLPSAQRVGSAIGESLGFQRAVVSLLCYCDPPCALAASCVIVGASGWWSLVLVPLHLAFWFTLGSVGSGGPAKIGIPGILLLGGSVVAGGAPDLSWLVRLAIVIVPGSWSIRPAMYYLVSRFAFDLIHRNFEFFRLFYYSPGHLGFPFIWTDPDDERFAPGIDAGMAQQMDKLTDGRE